MFDFSFEFYKGSSTLKQLSTKGLVSIIKRFEGGFFTAEYKYPGHSPEEQRCVKFKWGILERFNVQKMACHAPRNSRNW